MCTYVPNYGCIYVCMYVWYGLYMCVNIRNCKECVKNGQEHEGVITEVMADQVGFEDDGMTGSDNPWVAQLRDDLGKAMQVDGD